MLFYVATRDFKITNGSNSVSFGQHCSVEHCSPLPGQRWRCPASSTIWTFKFPRWWLGGNVGMSYPKTSQEAEPLSKFCFLPGYKHRCIQSLKSFKATPFSLENCPAINTVSGVGRPRPSLTSLSVFQSPGGLMEWNFPKAPEIGRGNGKMFILGRSKNCTFSIMIGNKNKDPNRRSLPPPF